MPSSSKIFPGATAEKGPTLDDVAQLIKDGKAKRIIFLVGAGISTAAGIPDFRSPETGLYANLEQYQLPYPEAIFELSYFFRHPEAFFTLAREIFPGNYLPTLTHYFFVLLARKHLLTRVFTQNVDTLERIAGLHDDRIVEAHGSFATATCTKCGAKHTAQELKPRIAKGEVLRCTATESCRKSSTALIKSDIVFFGEGLPALFFKRMSDLRTCDLLVTIGTSLKVQPFASLIERVPDECPRVLINLETVGAIGEVDDDSDDGGVSLRYRDEGFDFEGLARGGREYARDVRWLGEADKGIAALARALGWEDELRELYEQGRAELQRKEAAQGAQSAGSSSGGASVGRGPVGEDKDKAGNEPHSAAAETAHSVAKHVEAAVTGTADPAQVAAGEAKDSEDFDELAQRLEELDVARGAEAQSATAISDQPPDTGNDASPARPPTEKKAGL